MSWTAEERRQATEENLERLLAGADLGARFKPGMSRADLLQLADDLRALFEVDRQLHQVDILDNIGMLIAWTMD